MADCFEAAMCVMLDTAVFFVMLNIIKKNGKNEAFGRFAALAFGTGFLTGLAAKIYFGRQRCYYMPLRTWFYAFVCGVCFFGSGKEETQ